MGYQEAYGDLEDYASALKFSKVKKAWFRISNQQEEIKAERAYRLEDGTTEKRVVPGIRYSASITLTAFGFVSPPETIQKDMGGSFNPPKPDTQLLFTSQIAQKDCFADPNTNALDPKDVAEYNVEVEVSWKSVIAEVNKIWTGAFFEGVGSIIGGV